MWSERFSLGKIMFFLFCFFTLLFVCIFAQGLSLKTQHVEQQIIIIHTLYGFLNSKWLKRSFSKFRHICRQLCNTTNSFWHFCEIRERFLRILILWWILLCALLGVRLWVLLWISVWIHWWILLWLLCGSFYEFFCGSFLCILWWVLLWVQLGIPSLPPKNVKSYRRTG